MHTYYRRPMARRKKQYISDHDSDTSDGSQSDVDDLDDFKNGGAGSHEDPDERAERLRFTDPYGRKGRNKRKRDGKEEALYGVFHDGGDGDDAARGSRSNKALRRCVPCTQPDHPGPKRHLN